MCCGEECERIVMDEAMWRYGKCYVDKLVEVFVGV